MHLSIIFCFFLFIISHTFTPNWGIYYWISPKIPNITPKSIVLSNPIHPSFYFLIRSHNKLDVIENSYAQITLKPPDENFEVLVINHGNKLCLMIRNLNKEKIKNIRVSMSLMRDRLEKSEQVKAIQQNIKQQSKQICQISNDAVSKNGNFHPFTIHCTISQTFIFDIFTKKESIQAQFYASLETDNQKTHRNKIELFMKHYGIPNNKINYQMVNYAITSLFSSICVIYDQLDQFTLGFCIKESIQYKFTPFVLKIVKGYDKLLSERLYEFYLSALQAQLYYPTTQQEKTNSKLIPQYLQFFAQSKQFSRVSSLSNTIFVKALLQQLTSLHKQLNYREKKKLHPALKQMLTQPWLSSKTSFKFLKKDYSEAFTQDFYTFYQSPYRLYHSATKMNWLIKLYEIYYYLRVQEVKQIVQENEKNEEYLFEERTLLELLTKMFVAEDPNMRVGEYLDIGQNQLNETLLYSQRCGYGNLLAYMYVEGGFPRRCLHQLISALGIKSSDQKISVPSSKYRYRGAISSYFNVRLLPHFYKSLPKQPDLPLKEQQQIRKVLEAMWNQTQDYIQQVFHKKKRIYTSWSEDGEGYQSITWLRIISVLFLGDLSVISKL